MSKKCVEDLFSKEIDAYVKGIERSKKVQSKEYNELLELGKKFVDNDFSKSSNKKEVFNKTLKNINNMGDGTVKKSNKARRIITKVACIALVCILSFSIMQTSSAQEVVGKIVKTISLGHITIFEEEPSENMEPVPVPEQLKGKIFDKDGNAIEKFDPNKRDRIYTADGEIVVGFDTLTNEIKTLEQEEKTRSKRNLVVKGPNKLNDYTCFNVLLPSYLPEGYKFDRAEFYKDENGVVENTKYINIYFTNEKGEHIFMQQRFADEENAYEGGSSGQVDTIKINGVDAVIYDNSIDWEANGVLYGLNGHEINRTELIKIAESIK